MYQSDAVGKFWSFIRERHLVHLRRAEGAPPPWTDDPILSSYRFCNIYRELDRVTDWLRREWREPHADDPDLWFAFVVARHMNNIPLLAALDGPPLPWRPEHFRSVCETRRRAGEQVFGGAYMIGTRHSGSKADYLATMVFQPLWDARERIRPRSGDTLTAFHMSLGLFYGLASFMSGQVVADVKYTEPLLSAADWSTFCCSGPGSRRGLNRLLGRPARQSWDEDDFRLSVLRLREELLPLFSVEGWPEPHAQDVQNCLCEYDKYSRTLSGEGRPKQRYTPLAPGSSAG